MNGYRVFKKGSYKFNPFVIYGKTLENTFEITFSEYGSKKDLSFGIFKMENNHFELTYPNDEVMMIMEGGVIITTDNGELNLEAGDIIQVKEGLKATITTKRFVKIFFVGFPVRSVQ